MERNDIFKKLAQLIVAIYTFLIMYVIRKETKR